MKDLTKELYFKSGDSTTITEITKLANELLAIDWKINIYRNRIETKINLKDLWWKFNFNNRKRSAGLCNSRTKEISLSMHLFSQNMNNATQWEETLRHELAHAIDFCIRKKSAHDLHWRMIAREILSTGERCYSYKEIQDTKSKYTAVCDNCNREVPKHKKTKVKKACGKCCRTYNNGRFSEKYILRFIQNY